MLRFAIQRADKMPGHNPAVSAKLFHVFIARELYGLTREDWQHLTGTFTFGGGDSKAELDEIIRQSLTLWP